MAEPNRDVALAAFKQTFRQLAPYRHRYEVFRDFVTMAACSLHNGIHKDEAREEEYLRIIGQYKPDDQQALRDMLGPRNHTSTRRSALERTFEQAPSEQAASA